MRGGEGKEGEALTLIYPANRPRVSPSARKSLNRVAQNPSFEGGKAERGGVGEGGERKSTTSLFSNRFLFRSRGFSLHGYWGMAKEISEGGDEEREGERGKEGCRRGRFSSTPMPDAEGVRTS